MSLTAMFFVSSGFTWRLHLSRVHLAVALEPGQEVPAMPAHRLQVGKATVPTVEADILGAELAFLRRLKHRQKVVILGHLRFAFFGGFVESTVTGQTAQAVRPKQGRQVDAFNDRMMLPAPMARDQAHLLRVGLVQRSIIYDQQTAPFVDQRLDLMPQRRCVWRQSCQEARVGIMRSRSRTAGGFGAGVDPLGGDQKLDVVHIGHFGRVHHTQYEPKKPPKSTA